MNAHIAFVRAELWARVIGNYLVSGGGLSADFAAKYADQAVAEFDKRFQKTIESDEQSKKEP